MSNQLQITAIAACFMLFAPGYSYGQTVAAPQISGDQHIMANAQHADFTRLLTKYVVPEKGDVNRVDYGAFKESAKDQAALDAYIAGFEAMDMEALSEAEAIAAWSNLYNALTIRHILDRYPLDSIKDGYLFSGPWKKVKTVAGGQSVSLHDIEHEVLRKTGDPRIHYAINCASYSCPDLQPKAWEAATLDKDLDKAARAYINDPRGVTVTDRGLTVSSIYDWFEEDFGGSKSGVLAHMTEYAGKPLKKSLNAAPKIRRYEYDWSLNDVE